jgi:hypothetical protein
MFLSFFKKDTTRLGHYDYSTFIRYGCQLRVVDAPTRALTMLPTSQPTNAPILPPTNPPTFQPTSAPTALPTNPPTTPPTNPPTKAASAPTSNLSPNPNRVYWCGYHTLFADLDFYLKTELFFPGVTLLKGL